jgi:hypothetical protein
MKQQLCATLARTPIFSFVSGWHVSLYVPRALADVMAANRVLSLF